MIRDPAPQCYDDHWQAEDERHYPLHVSADRGDLEAVRDLLAAGADPNGLDDAQWTPLMWATDREVVLALLAAGGNPRYATSDGEAVLMALARRADPSTLRTFIEVAQANVNAVDEDGNTALMEAAAVGAVENVVVLLSNGADPSLTTADGGSAESAAAAAGYQDVLNVLERARSAQSGP